MAQLLRKVSSSKEVETIKMKLIFILIYLAFMSARAIFNPFLTVYLSEKGLDAQWIGVVMGINSFITILAQPVWGILSDKLQSVRTALAVSLIGQSFISLMLIGSEGFLVITICFCIYTFFSSSQNTLLDTWSLYSLKGINDEKSVGHLKLWGCLGFAGSSILSGMFINRYSTIKVIPIFSIILFAIAVLILLVKINGIRTKPLKIRDMELWKIYKNISFIVFLVFVMFMQFPHRAGYTFFPILLENLGGTKAMVGYCSAIMFVSQALVLFLSKRLLTKLPPKLLIVFSAFFFILWQLGYGFATKPYHILMLCALDGPSFGLFTISTLYYLDSIAPDNLKTTYQTIAYAFYFGISGIIGNTLGGVIIEYMGYKTMYILGAIVIFISTAIFFSVDAFIFKKEKLV